MNKLLITLMMAAGLAACSQESKQEAQEAASAVASEVQTEASSVQAAAQEAAPSAEAASTEAKPEEKAEAKPEAKAEASVAVDGQKVFEASCKMCHGGTIPGAPVVGKKDDWAPRIAKGKETLHKHAIEGFNAMPAKGGNAGLSDDEVKAAVDYMANQSGATF
ncbi:c-type cytochrome [Neisseria cinerea]|uniref:c-type cytochrome n=1 Tax=Neisseria cinerea TaxID=483 RepID=UPI000D37150D|nr:c-type cytochrome [Neisseria cinerea]